jgi:hypothetical protein
MDIRAQLEQILQNPDSVRELKEETVSALQKTLSPHGIIGPANGEKQLVNMSILNWRESYMRRIHMTSLIGYLNRTVADWDPYEFEGVFEDGQRSAKALDAMYKLPAVSSSSDNKLPSDQSLGNNRLDKAQVQAIVSDFLARNFNFNPDLHVREAGRTKGTDSKTASKDKAAVADEVARIRAKCLNPTAYGADQASRSASAAKIYAEFAPLLADDDTRSRLKSALVALGRESQDASALVARSALEASVSCSNILKTVSSLSSGLDSPIFEEDSGLLVKNREELNSARSRLEPYVADDLAAVGRDTAFSIPPAEVFYNWERYLTNHYEVIRDVVAALYFEQPDIEFAVQLFEAYSGPDAEAEAKAYRFRHEAAMVAPMLTVETGAWTLLGPFRQNTERYEFYNKNSEMIKRLFEQAESDQKMGSDLIKKVVRRKKAQNIKEDGPDAPGLEEYKSVAGTADRLKKSEVLTKEDKEEILKKQQEKEMAEVPDNAVQMDVYRPDAQGLIVRDKIYIEAEQPNYLNETAAKMDMSKLGVVMPKVDSKASESSIFGAHKSIVGTDQRVLGMQADGSNTSDNLRKSSAEAFKGE